jgi:hypothetical protein
MAPSYQRGRRVSMKSWHAAKILFEARVADRASADALREESIRVFLSDGLDLARHRAEELGRAAEHEYQNEYGELVRWTFVTVLEVQDLCAFELQDGAEVFSVLSRHAPPPAPVAAPEPPVSPLAVE